MNQKLSREMNEGLAEVCEGLAEYDRTPPAQKKRFLDYAKIFRNIEKTTNVTEVINMGKKLTEKEVRSREVGISEDILLAYVLFKTKLSKKSVMAVLNSQTEFYQKLVNDAMLDNLEENGNN